MTANWRLKRRVRARAAKTGESYTAALRHLRRAEEAQMSTYEIRPGGATDVGHVRPTNQDQMLVSPRLAVVADGAGDGLRGAIASDLAVQTLRSAFDLAPTGVGLLDAARSANQAVWERASSSPDLQGMGTTLAAVAVVDDGLAVVNVGDSRVYLLHDGSMRRLSLDHSLVGDLVRSGQLSEEEARSHPERHVLTQMIGVGPSVEPHSAETTAVVGDRLLLCSDGLFTELTEDEIQTVLVEVTDPEEAASLLVHLATAHGGNDNATAVVLDVTG